MEAHLAPTQPTQVNKITTSCEICNGPHDTQYCMEDPEQAFIEYASSRTDEVGGKWYTFKSEQNNLGDTYNPSWKSHPNLSLGNISSNPHPQPDPLASIATKQVRKLNSMLESLGLVPQSSNTKFVCTKEEDGEVMFIEIIRDDDEPHNESPNEGEGTTTKGPAVEYFDTFPIRDELAYHKYLMCGPIPSVKESSNQGLIVNKVKMENSSDQEQDGKDKSVKSSSLIGSLMPRGLKEAQEMMIFCSGSLT
ncbi:hypothetical protein Tco_0744359 [Tanacetum coccineum]